MTFIMNFAFISLILTLLGLAVLTSGNIHILIMLLITIGLFASTQWYFYYNPRFLIEMNKKNDSEVEQLLPTL